MPLSPHQERVLDKLEKNKKVLVYHGLGSGKTYTALAAGDKLDAPVNVIGPASLKGNFKKEKKKFKTKKPVNYTSYTKPHTKDKHKLLVYDEAHRMGRLESQRSKYPDKYKSEYSLLLTGTPIRNSPDELIPLLRGVGINAPRDSKKFLNYFVEHEKVKPNIFARVFKGIKPGTQPKAKNLDKLQEVLKGKVDYHPSSGENFPSKKVKRVEVPMSDKQIETYRMAAKGSPSLAYKVKHGLPPSKSESGRMNAFLNATRQISNTPSSYNLSAEKPSPKIQQIIKDIKTKYKKDPNYKGVTYSNYLDSGVNSVAERLKDSKIPYAMFTGNTSPQERKEIVKKYNKGKIKQLLISGAGSEGLDLKGTKMFQVTEPHWNSARLNQAIGRAVRRDSHSHLPKAERNVEVRKYVSVLPEPGKIKKFFGAKRPISTDEYLYDLSKKKDKLNQQFLDTLKRAS